MIKKMRIKFIALTMAALLILLTAILFSMNIYMNNHWEKEISDHLKTVVSLEAITPDGELPDGASPPDGVPPDGVSPHVAPDNATTESDATDLTSSGNLPRPKDESLIQGFTVMLDEDENIIEIIDNNTSLSDESITSYTETVLATKVDSGEIETMNYLIQDKDYGTIIAFADRGTRDVMLEDLRNLSILIGGISVVLLLAIVTILSNLVTKPVEEAFTKQKQFIADSSHELKTPLSILSANADMLESEIGENKRITEISTQSRRMNKLINELLVLARNENAGANIILTEFNLSHAVLKTLLPFEVVAFEHQKQIEYDIDDNIKYVGSEKNIKRMAEALIDNAVKYSNPKTSITVKLYKKSSKIILEVYNKGPGVNEDQKLRLFDKFYRTDDSRARETGGYGIGLSLVKSIVDMHKGKIEVESKFGEDILFRVILSE